MEDKNILDKQIFLRASQVAKILGLSRTAVYTLMHKGIIPYKKIGNNILIPRSYIESIIDDINKETVAK